MPLVRRQSLLFNAVRLLWASTAVQGIRATKWESPGHLTIRKETLWKQLNRNILARLSIIFKPRPNGKDWPRR